MIPNKRVLTFKSKMGFGKIKDYTVREMLDRRKHKDLISAYFKLTSIDFIPNVLDELEITKEFRIEKPSSDLDMYYKFLKQSRYQAPSKTRSSGLEKLKGFSKPISGAKLTRVNHGH